MAWFYCRQFVFINLWYLDEFSFYLSLNFIALDEIVSGENPLTFILRWLYVTHIPFVVEMSSVIENSNSVVANGFPSDHSDAALSDIDREEKQRLIKQVSIYATYIKISSLEKVVSYFTHWILKCY